MVFSKYREEGKQLTGVPTFLTKLTVVAPLNKVAVNVHKSSCQVADILLSTGRKLRISLLIFIRIACYGISLKSLELDVVSSEIQRFAQKHKERLHLHENVEAIQLLDNLGIVRRLQKKKPFELV
jgi:hypothetical protein